MAAAKAEVRKSVAEGPVPNPAARTTLLIASAGVSWWPSG